MKYRISKTSEILRHLSKSIEDKSPFSLMRFGDGGLKMMNSIFKNNNKNIKIIGEKEGIPEDKIKDILNLWVKYANDADYIDTPSVYDKKYFWGRYKKEQIPINKGTARLLLKWEAVYNRCGIRTTDRRYCNPEFNWLAILNSNFNLLNLLTNKKICFISIYDNLPRLSKFDITYKKIVGHYENQFKNSFQSTIEYINENANEYDLWLNSSGELGRVYSGRIKELGGRVLDMGFVAQYWNNFQRPERFNKFIEPDISNSLMMKLTSNGLVYKRNI